MSNREIKFRGKRVDNGEWVLGDLLHYIMGEDQLVYTTSIRSAIICHVTPETVGQYTGLKDKHGKEIYEGDIIQQGNNPECWFAPRVVEFINGSWSGKHKNSNEYIRIYVEQDRHEYQNKVSNNGWEIIGNIHENPELLK